LLSVIRPPALKRPLALVMLCASLGACGGSARHHTTRRAPQRPPVTVPGGPVARSQAPGAKPNVVFILTDDLSLNLLRFMPHVRAMQREGAGVTFLATIPTIAFTPAAMNSVSRLPRCSSIQNVDASVFPFEVRPIPMAAASRMLRRLDGLPRLLGPAGGQQASRNLGGDFRDLSGWFVELLDEPAARSR